MGKGKVERLAKGETFITSEKGNSMTPLIKSGQKHEVTPTDWTQCQVGDIVFCKVKGRFYTHIVSARSNRGVQISNIRGKVNGWTRAVYGKVIRIL